MTLRWCWRGSDEWRQGFGGAGIIRRGLTTLEGRRTMTRLAVAIVMLGLLPLTAVAESHHHTCIAQNYGAKADGVTMDTHAIQAAIDDCSERGGGKVVLKGGTFLSAPLELKSYVNLEIDKGAVLLGSKNMEDYPLREDAPWRRVALIHASSQTNISITGEGTIDGSGEAWWEMARKFKKVHDTLGSEGHPRPFLIDITRSQRVRIEGLTVTNSPMYNITCFICSYLTVKGVTIRNPSNAPNTDGIDPFSCDHVLIEKVTIDTGDDDIAIKSGLVERGEPNIATSHVVIRNSHFLHGHGLSIGSEVAGGVHDLKASNITIENTTNGIRIKSNRGRGNDLYDLNYDKIRIINVPMPLLITEYYPRIPATDTAQPMSMHTPRFRNINIKNVTITGAREAGEIVGLPESPVKKVKLSNITIGAKSGLTIRDADVAMSHVVINAANGPGIIRQSHAEVDAR